MLASASSLAHTNLLCWSNATLWSWEANKWRQVTPFVCRGQTEATIVGESKEVCVILIDKFGIGFDVKSSEATISVT